MKRETALGLSLAGAGAILFASKGLFSKALFHGGMDFVTMTSLRAVLALPMFFALGLSRGVKPWRASGKSIALAALAGVFCYGLGSMVDFRALELIDVSLERALIFTYPALIVAWQAITRRTQPDRRTLVALGLTYIGIVLVVGAFDADLWRQNLAGSLLVLFSAMTTASYFLLGERCIPELGSGGFTIVAMTAAAVVVVATFLFTHELSVIAAVTWTQWLLLLALSVLCMFLPTLLQASGIKRVGAARGSLAGTIGPPAALFMGMLLLGERPGAWQLLGTGLILVGIYVTSRR